LIKGDDVDDLAARRKSEEDGPLAQEIIDKVKAQHPGAELYMWSTPDGTAVICKAPNRGEYKRFRQMVVDPARKAESLETLLLGCVVYPPAADMFAILDRRPGYAEVFGEKLAGIAGAGQEVNEKKL
jgi:hypothetical protein